MTFLSTGRHRIGPAAEPGIAVVIPSLNEEARLGRTIARVRECGEPVRIVVADGGSSDATVPLAESLGAEAIVVPGGRAAQLNAGAAATKADILLFLHADTLLPLDWPDHVRRTLARPNTAAGAFRLLIDDGRSSLRLMEFGAQLRSRFFQLPYGDQALFMTRRMFDRAGGFPELALMDDYALVKRLKRLGRIRIAPAGALTSARRWRGKGPFRTWWLNQVIIVGFHLGIDSATLARIYRRGSLSTFLTAAAKSSRR